MPAAATDFRKQLEASLTEGLNPVQREGVLHDEGPLLIVAGAGSGKTRVITHRIAYLSRIKGVAPYRIAAVTFTNKAAKEMQERLSGLIGPMAQYVFVRTFHSLGLYILSRNVDKTGLKSGFSIYDASAQKTLLKQIAKEFGLSGDVFTPRALATKINMARDRLIGPEKFAEVYQDFYSKDIAEIYKEYIKRLRKMNAFDFGDLLYEAALLLIRNPAIKEYYQDTWKYFMIDEYQDTNHVQYILGKLIAGEHRNVMVVGDDDQAIYSWRGADITNILNFEKDYGEAKILKLEENYRSTAHILQAASSVIANNTERRKKTLFTEREGGEKIPCDAYDDEMQEARSVISQIQSLKSKGYDYKDIAIFYRTNAQSRAFETSLRDARLPYMIVGDIRFYERREIKDLLAYLAVIVNPDDEISLERIINVPARGVGATGLEKLRHLALDLGESLLHAFPRSDSLPRFRGAAKLKSLYEHFMSWIAMNHGGEPPSLIANRVLEESGYLSMLENDPSPEAPGRIENLYSLIASIEEYEKEIEEANRSGKKAASLTEADARARPLPDHPDLADYLQRISLYSTREGESDVEAPDQQDMVYLMTLHNAKGLEYPVVFLTGVEEELLPHGMALQDGSEEEERRLMYVGITRAKERLFVSYARRRNVMGSFQDRMPSRFIDEMDPAALIRNDTEFRAQNEALFSAPRSGQARRLNWKKKPDDASQTEDYQKGDRIRHSKYGSGTVVEVEQTETGPKLGIRFDTSPRIRSFLVKYTPLTRL